jgi:hypothetical protein
VNPFIVAEVSKNWKNGVSMADTPLLSVQFEHVININAERGYELETFAIHRQMTGPDVLNETIIAVFRYVR